MEGEDQSRLGSGLLFISDPSMRWIYKTRLSEGQPLYPHLQDPTPNTAPSQALIRPFITFKESG